MKGGVHHTDLITAEVSKTVENAYRDVQIAFANEVALLCEALGIDVYNVRQFVNGLPNDPSAPHANPVRNMHFPGAGVGGHCLPKDTSLSMHGYNQYASVKTIYPSSVMTNARRLEMTGCQSHMVDLLETSLKEADRTLKGSLICVLGYALPRGFGMTRETLRQSLY